MQGERRQTLLGDVLIVRIHLIRTNVHTFTIMLKYFYLEALILCKKFYFSLSFCFLLIDLLCAVDLQYFFSFEYLTSTLMYMSDCYSQIDLEAH